MTPRSSVKESVGGCPSPPLGVLDTADGLDRQGGARTLPFPAPAYPSLGSQGPIEFWAP